MVDLLGGGLNEVWELGGNEMNLVRGMECNKF